MKVANGVRCDACCRIEQKNPVTPDRRPPVGSRDRWFDMVVPPDKADVSPLTGKVKPGKFRGIAAEGNPQQLAALHICPGCSKRVKKAFSGKDPELLPAGPLRELMRVVHMKYGMKSARMH